MKNAGIALKLIVLILASILLILTGIFFHNQRKSLNIHIKNIERSANHLSLSILHQIETILKSVEKVPSAVAISLEENPPSREELLGLLSRVVESNSEIYGACIAFEPFGFDKQRLYFAPYYFKDDDKLGFTYIGGESYNYFSWEWYRVPKNLNAKVWSEPYFDEGAGNILMSTYSVPFYEKGPNGQKFAGVTTADICLTCLERIISNIQMSKTGFAFLISKTGAFITHPRKDFIKNETIFSVAEARKDAELEKIGRDMLAGKTDFVMTRSLPPGKESWLFYSPLPSIGWSLGIVFPKNELLAELTGLHKEILLLTSAGLALLLLTIILIARSITKPLRLLSQAAEEIGAGNLDAPLPPITSRDEVGRLAESFAAMGQELKKHIQDLTAATADRERIESELEFAHLVQEGFLPEAPPDHPGFEFAASTMPARFVGGDFYDFIPIEKNKLGILIGDVSGKGVSAALYMARLMSDFRHLSQIDPDPGRVMRRVNGHLYERSRRGMFATACFILLDLETREIQLANAGHFPLLIRAPSGDIIEQGTGGGIPLGMLPGENYNTQNFQLEPGDLVLLYTDGLIEPTNENGEQFGFGRLHEALENNQAPLKVFIKDLCDAIQKFSRNAAPHDDLTLVGFQAL